ncbi:KR domain-containing protein [Pseudonocardiaceae bacterium YIM PH 21723]|nr:KR domain-containing protein [Pseudonocardiaceae bacterium YIM PH 21723]
MHSTGRNLLTIEYFRLKRLGGDLPELFEQQARRLCYDLHWVAADPCPQRTAGGTVLVIGDDLALQSRLGRHYDNVVTRHDNVAIAGGTGLGYWETVLRGVLRDHGDLRAVIYVYRGDHIRDSAVALELVQALSALPVPPRLWLVTTEAQSLAAGAPIDPQHSALWGLGRVVRYEMPDLRCSLVDLPQVPSSADLSALSAEVAMDGPEDELALRCGNRYTARLVNGQLPAEGQAVIRSDASYLITGGLGGAGLLTAGWLIGQGARHLVLTGRSAPDEETRDRLELLAHSGADIRVVRADVADRDRMAEVIAGMQPPPRGVVHSAVVLDDGILSQLTAERFLAVMPPKVDGAWNLHELTEDLELDFFVLYSSAASLIGSPGQGNYAAANAYLDGLAHHRKARGLPALSVNWGQWTDTGRVAKAEHDLRLADRGFRRFDPADGLAVLGRLLGASQAQAAVMSFDPAVWAGDFPALRTGSLLRALDTTPAEPADARVAELDAQDDATALVTISGYLCGRVGHVVKAGIREIVPGQRLNRLGIDSLMAVQLRNRITEDLGVTLPVAVFLQRGTIGHLAGLVLAELRPTRASLPVQRVPKAGDAVLT